MEECLENDYNIAEIYLHSITYNEVASNFYVVNKIVIKRRMDIFK